MRISTEQFEQFIENTVTAYKDLVGGQSVTATDRVRQAISEYRSEFLPEIDRRLTECNELLRRGLREEALAYAHEHPDLLRIGSLVDFRRYGPEFEQWNAVAADEGVVQWPLPKVEFLESLLVAEQESLDLKPLIDTWRRLNYGRASLQQRINVLRELRRRDPNCTAWAEMLHEFEEYRLTQIETSLRGLKTADAKSPQFVQQAKSLQEELEASWASIQPPSPLLKQTKVLLQRAEIHERERTLSKLAERIAQADKEDNQHALSLLFAEWTEFVLTPEEAQRYKSICSREKQFFDRQRFEQLTVELQQSIGESQPSQKARFEWRQLLERQWNELDDLTASIPLNNSDREALETLHDRVWTTIESVDREQRTKRFLRLSSLAAAVCLIVGLSFSYVWMTQRERMTGDALRKLTEATTEVQSGTVFEEPKFYQQWPDWLTEDPLVIVAVDDLQTSFANQKSRRARLDALVKKVTPDLRALATLERDSPLDQWPNSFRALAEAAAEINQPELAILDSEKSKATSIQKQAGAIANRWLAAADTSFDKEVSSLLQKLVLLRRDVRDDLKHSRQSLSLLDGELASLQQLARFAAIENLPPPFTDTNRVSPKAADLVSANAPVSTQLKQLRKILLKLEGLEKRELVADQQLQQGLLGPYASTIGAIAVDLSGTDNSESVDYRLVVDEKPAWESMSSWADFCRKLSNPSSLDAADCSAFLKRINALDKAVTKLPYAQKVHELETFIENGIEQTAMRVDTLSTGLRTIFEGRFGNQINGTIWNRNAQVNDFDYVYCLLRDRPLADKKDSNVERIVGWKTDDGWPTSRFSFDPEKHFVADSPQCRLANTCLQELGELRRGRNGPYTLESDIFFILNSASLATNAKGDGNQKNATPVIDPCFHFLLLRSLILHCLECDEDLKADFPKTLSQIEAGQDKDTFPVQLRGIDNEIFMNVFNTNSNLGGFAIEQARASCFEFIKTFRQELDRSDERIKEEKEMICDLEFVWYEINGRLQKQLDGSVLIRGGNPDLRENNSIFVAERPYAGSATKLLVRCDSNGNIPQDKTIRGRAGTPVFTEHKIILNQIPMEPKAR